MTIWSFIFFVVLSFFLELLYTQIAKRYSIVDRPNERSAHNHVTIRGLGIVVPMTAIGFCFFYGFLFPYFLIGLFLISGISFWDDLKSVSKRLRFLTHIFAILLLIFQIHQSYFFNPYLFLLVALGVGIMNAVNFMDGINGITGFYGLICLLSLYWINRDTEFIFINAAFLEAIIASILVFLFFNFRKKAVGFAGDVGSIGIAFIYFFSSKSNKYLFELEIPLCVGFIWYRYRIHNSI